MDIEQLNVLLNDWPEGVDKYDSEKKAIEVLYEIGNEISFDRLGQMAGIMYLIMDKRQVEEAVQLKVQRFDDMGYDIPETLEHIITLQASHTPKAKH